MGWGVQSFQKFSTENASLVTVQLAAETPYVWNKDLCISLSPPITLVLFSGYIILFSVYYKMSQKYIWGTNMNELLAV